MATQYGTAIRQARKRLGRTQRDVAEALGLYSSYLCNVENGRLRPGPEIAARITALLGVPDAPDPRPRVGRPSFNDGPPAGTIASVAYAARFVVAIARFHGVLIDRLFDALDDEPYGEALIAAARRVAYCGYYKGKSIENLNYVLGVYAARQGMGLDPQNAISDLDVSGKTGGSL